MHYSKPFTKLFSSIITSSIWNENDKVRVVWITMLALSDANGFVCASVGGLAHAARVKKEECEAALGCLLSPDDDSRSQEFNGQRIEVVDGGYLILNYKKYRDLGRKIDRDEYLADKQWESRQKRKRASTNVNTASIPVDKVSTNASASASASMSASKRRGENEEVVQYCISIALTEDDGNWFWDKCEGSGWKNDGKPIGDWKATARSWKRIKIFPSQKNGQHVDNRRQMSAFEIDKRRTAITQEINATFKKNGNKRVEGDGIDELKHRRDELQRQLIQ